MIGTTAALLLAGGAAAASGAGKYLGGKSASNAAKRIGTEEANFWTDEEGRAHEGSTLVNPWIQDAYDRAQGLTTGTAFPQADLVQQRAEQAGQDVIGAGRAANEYLNPYMQYGGESLKTLSTLANAPSERFDPTNLQMDPGYAFRAAEGAKALERSAAARGGLQGGGTLKALAGYSQNLASQEYQAAFNRAKDTFSLNQGARRDQLNTLTNLAQFGYGASGQAGQNLINTNQYAGTLGTQASQFGANMRVNANNRVGDLGINSALAQGQLTLNDIAQARQDRVNRMQASTGSQVASANARAQGTQGLFNIPGDFLSLYSMAKGSGMVRPGGGAGGGASVPSWVYTGQIPGGRGIGRTTWP